MLKDLIEELKLKFCNLNQIKNASPMMIFSENLFFEELSAI